jgi:hypothetical protein
MYIPVPLYSITSTELRAIWNVLIAIYHLGVAGVTQYTMGRAGFAKSQVQCLPSASSGGWWDFLNLGVAGVTQYTMGRAGFAKSQVQCLTPQRL